MGPRASAEAGTLARSFPLWITLCHRFSVTHRLSRKVQACCWTDKFRTSHQATGGAVAACMTNAMYDFLVAALIADIPLRACMQGKYCFPSLEACACRTSRLGLNGVHVACRGAWSSTWRARARGGLRMSGWQQTSRVPRRTRHSCARTRPRSRPTPRLSWQATRATHMPCMVFRCSGCWAMGFCRSALAVQRGSVLSWFV